MNFRSLLRRHNSTGLPQLPAAERDDNPDDRVDEKDEKLERLLTPAELDLVRRHRV